MRPAIAPLLALLATTPTACGPGESPPARAWPLGHVVSSDLRFESTDRLTPSVLARFTLDPRGVPASEHRAVVQGTLEEAFVEAPRDGSAREWIFLVSPKIELDGSTDGPGLESIRTDLAAGALVDRDAHGRVVGIALPPHASPAGAALLEYVASQLAYTLPGVSEGWDAEEAGPAGSAKVRYHASREGARVTLARTLLGPVSAAVDVRGPVRQARLEHRFSGQARLVFDGPSAVPISIEASARREMVATALQSRLSRSDMHLVLRRTGQRRATKRTPDFGRARTLFPPPDLDRDALEAARRTLGRAQASALGEQLAAGLGRFPDVAAGFEERLRAALLVFPALCDGVLGYAARDPSEPATSVVLRALVAAGHGPAQAVLRQVVERSRPRPEDAQSGVALLGMLEQPDEETLAYLRGLATDRHLGSTAELAQGSLAFALQAREPNRAARLIAPFVRELAAGPAPARAAQLLDVLGNAAAPELGLLAPRYLDAPATRRAATYALRFLVGPEVDGHLRKVLANDDAGGALVEALMANNLRAPTQETADILARRAADALPEHVRQILLDELRTAKALLAASQAAQAASL